MFFFVKENQNFEVEKTIFKQKIISFSLNEKVDYIKNTKEPSKKQKISLSKLSQKLKYIKNTKKLIFKSKKVYTILFFNDFNI